FAHLLSAVKPSTYLSFHRFHQRFRLVDMSMVGLSSLKPAFTKSAGTLPSVSTKRSTSKYFRSSQSPNMPIFEKSIGPAMLMKFFTGISGCEAMNEADSGAPMQ